ETADTDGGQGHNDESKALNANGRGHDASFSNLRRLSPADITEGKRGAQTCNPTMKGCNRSVTLSWPARRQSGRIFKAFPQFTSALESIRGAIAGFGLAADLLERRPRCKLDQRHSPIALLVDGKNAEIGDHHVHDVGAGQRQRAALEELGLVLGRM